MANLINSELYSNNSFESVSDLVLTILDNCKIEGNFLFLPKVQLEKTLYLEVNKIFENIGGYWDMSKQCHIFPSSPEIYINNILYSGKYINLRNHFQFFPTPEEIINLMILSLSLNEFDIALEPQAGTGNIAKRLKKICHKVYACELNPIFSDNLIKDGFDIISNNFLDLTEEKFKSLNINTIIANPPFSKFQYIDHFIKMYELLPYPGKLACLVWKGYTYATDEKSKEFREFLKIINAKEIEIPAGSFTDTTIETILIVVNKLPVSNNVDISFLELFKARSFKNNPANINVLKITSENLYSETDVKKVTLTLEQVIKKTTKKKVEIEEKELRHPAYYLRQIQDIDIEIKKTTQQLKEMLMECFSKKEMDYYFEGELPETDYPEPESEEIMIEEKITEIENKTSGTIPLQMPSGEIKDINFQEFSELIDSDKLVFNIKSEKKEKPKQLSIFELV